MTAPSWPFSSPLLGSDLDQAAALLPWRAVTHYEISTPEAFGTVHRLGRYSYATVISGGVTQGLGAYLSDGEAMAAVDQAITELAADS